MLGPREELSVCAASRLQNRQKFYKWHKKEEERPIGRSSALLVHAPRTYALPARRGAST